MKDGKLVKIEYPISNFGQVEFGPEALVLECENHILRVDLKTGKYDRIVFGEIGAVKRAGPNIFFQAENNHPSQLFYVNLEGEPGQNIAADFDWLEKVYRELGEQIDLIKFDNNIKSSNFRIPFIAPEKMTAYRLYLSEETEYIQRGRESGRQWLIVGYSSLKKVTNLGNHIVAVLETGAFNTGKLFYLDSSISLFTFGVKESIEISVKSEAVDEPAYTHLGVLVQAGDEFFCARSGKGWSEQTIKGELQDVFTDITGQFTAFTVWEENKTIVYALTENEQWNYKIAELPGNSTISNLQKVGKAMLVSMRVTENGKEIIKNYFAHPEKHWSSKLSEGETFVNSEMSSAVTEAAAVFGTTASGKSMVNCVSAKLTGSSIIENQVLVKAVIAGDAGVIVACSPENKKCLEIYSWQIGNQPEIEEMLESPGISVDNLELLTPSDIRIDVNVGEMGEVVCINPETRSIDVSRGILQFNIDLSSTHFTPRMEVLTPALMINSAI